MKSIIKRILKEEFDDLDWMRSVSGDIPEIDDKNKYLALVELLGVYEVFGDVTSFDDEDTEFTQNPWTHYGMDTFTLNNGEEWTVGTPEEMDSALKSYWESYVDDVGYDTLGDLSDYVVMGEFDRRSFADDMADHLVGDLGDNDLLERSGLEDEWNELEEEIDEITDQISDLELDDIDEGDETYDELSKNRDYLTEKQGRLIESAKEIVRSEEYDSWYECLDDPTECLVRVHGFYSSTKELIDYNVVSFDMETFVNDRINQSDYGEIGHYDGEYHEVGDYILIRLN